MGEQVLGQVPPTSAKLILQYYQNFTISSKIISQYVTSNLFPITCTYQRAVMSHKVRHTGAEQLTSTPHIFRQPLTLGFGQRPKEM
jgi:hypothetical protein